jgi:hypothetical protein
VAKVERRILEELLLERLAAAVDPGALLSLEADLVRSVTRALEMCALDTSAIELAQSLLRRAWGRLGRESLGRLCDEADRAG